MYDDGRAADQAAAVNEAGGAVWQELGYRTMQPSWALPKLRWMLDHAPGPECRRPPASGSSTRSTW